MLTRGNAGGGTPLCPPISTLHVGFSFTGIAVPDGEHTFQGRFRVQAKTSYSPIHIRTAILTHLTVTILARRKRLVGVCVCVLSFFVFVVQCLLVGRPWVLPILYSYDGIARRSWQCIQGPRFMISRVRQFLICFRFCSRAGLSGLRFIWLLLHLSPTGFSSDCEVMTLSESLIVEVLILRLSRYLFVRSSLGVRRPWQTIKCPRRPLESG